MQAKFLASHGATFGSSKKYESALMTAAGENNVSEVLRLLDHGVDPNCVDFDKRTPCHIAATNNNVELAKCLLDAHADPNLQV